MIYNYDGKLISNPKIQGTKCIPHHLYVLVEFLNRKKLSISNDILAIVDGANNKIIRFYDMSNGKVMNFTVDHTLEIQELHLNQTDMAGERKVAFVD